MCDIMVLHSKFTEKEVFKMRVSFLTVFLVIISIMFLASGSEAQNGDNCSYYLVTITDTGESGVDCWEICSYDGEADIYSDIFGWIYGYYTDLGTNDRELIGYGDGYEGCPGAVSLTFDGPKFLKGDGVCGDIIYRVEGQKVDNCYYVYD